MEETEAGIYTWCVADDIQYGDSLVAALFGLDRDNVRKGLPLSAYTERIHPDDRDEVTRLITKAVVTGGPFHTEYRVVSADGSVHQVIDLGRCYYDSSGMPRLCSGIVYPIEGLATDSEG